jgi:hypothetical protein
VSETPCATAAAFDELRSVVRARSGDEGFARLLAASRPEIREAFGGGRDRPDDLYAEALQIADRLDGSGAGELARAVGLARADAIVGPVRARFDDDPLKFLREGANLFYEGRATYGATSVELTTTKAVVRLVMPEHHARRASDLANPAPTMAGAFLERSVEIVAGAPHAPRYTGHAPRIDARFDRPMVNLLFEFDLEA